MATAIVARMTIKGAIGGKPGPSSSCNAAALVAADELVVIALRVSHGLTDVVATGAAAARTEGLAPRAAVGTAQSDSATAVAVILRPKPHIFIAPLEDATIMPIWIKIP